jgi:uncharacterized protein
VSGHPFLVSVTELVKHPGTQKPVHAAGPVGGMALTAAHVPDGADIAFDGVLEALTDGTVTATGTVTAPFVGECRRCLRDVEGEIAVDVQEVFSATVEDGETYPLDKDRLDLEPMIRDATLLTLPLAPLCDGGCQGPDPDGHPVTVAEDGDEVEAPPADPRWSALSDLRFD